MKWNDEGDVIGKSRGGSPFDCMIVPRGVTYCATVIVSPSPLDNPNTAWIFPAVEDKKRGRRHRGVRIHNDGIVI